MAAEQHGCSAPWNLVLRQGHFKGYRPRENFQDALVEGVGRYLGSSSRPEALVTFSVAIPEDAATASPIVEAPELSLAGRSAPRPLELLVRKFDPAARDVRSRSLGLRGEERAFHGGFRAVRRASRECAEGHQAGAMKLAWSNRVTTDRLAIFIWIAEHTLKPPPMLTTGSKQRPSASKISRIAGIRVGSKARANW